MCKNQIEGRTHICSASRLRISAQRTATNIPVRWNEHDLLPFFVFLLPLSAIDGEERLIPIYAIQDWSKSTRGGGEANLFSQVFQHVVGSNRDKTEKWPAKFIPWRRHHLHLNVVIRKPKSPCHRFKKVNDTMSPLPSSKPPWRDTIHPISSLLPERRSRKQISHTTKHSMINLISI
jgi:hypothetical protein